MVDDDIEHYRQYRRAKSRCGGIIVVAALVSLSCVMARCDPEAAFASQSTIRMGSPGPSAILRAGDRFRFRADVTSVLTSFHLKLVEGISSTVVDPPEHRQVDVAVQVTASDSTGIETLETYERIFDDTSSCDARRFERINGISVRNHFDANGNFLERIIETRDADTQELVDALFHFPVFDVGYLPPMGTRPGDSWTRETGGVGGLQRIAKYTLYPSSPCLRGSRCPMLTLDEHIYLASDHLSHGQYDIVADGANMVLLRQSGATVGDVRGFQSVTTERRALERVDAPSPRPSWMTERFGKLRVVLVPWAFVWVDGRLSAREVQTPFCVRLPAGRHIVRLLNEYVFRDETIDVAIGSVGHESIVIFRNWCRNLAHGPGCTPGRDSDDLRDMVRQDLAEGKIQQLLESVP